MRFRQLALAAFIAVLPAIASTPQTQTPSVAPISVKTGFVTGTKFRQMSPPERRTYTIGLVDGLFLSPLLGAPKARSERFEKCFTGMSDEQIAAILSKHLDDHPEDWHLSVNLSFYDAIVGRCSK